MTNCLALFRILIYNIYNNFEEKDVVEWVIKVISKNENIDPLLFYAAQQEFENCYRAISDAQEDVLGSINYSALEDELWQIWKKKWEIVIRQNELQKAQEEMIKIESKYTEWLYKQLEDENKVVSDI